MLNFRNLRVAVLTSRHAPGIESLIRHPHHGKLFEVVSVIASTEDLAQTPVLDGLGVPVFSHPIRRFVSDRGQSLRDPRARLAYDEVTAALLRLLEADTVLCLGYTLVLSEAMLAQFPNRILNIHDSDLTIRKRSGERCYTGLHSTRDAILAGERVTRSTVHFASARVDEGPVLLMSEPYPVAPFATTAALHGRMDVVKPYAFTHRATMMNDWGELAARGLECIAAGICDDGVVDGSDAFLESVEVPA